MDKAYLLSPSTLAFVGDAVYEVLVRSRIAETERPIGEQHRLSVTCVNANAQAEAFEMIKDLLTEKEMSVFKRGRNNHVGQIPKCTTVGLYHTATGLEALFGYLHINEQFDRMNELFDVIWGGLLDKT